MSARCGSVHASAAPCLDDHFAYKHGDLKMKTRTRLWVALAAPLLLAPALSLAESWEYVSYKKDKTSGQYMRDNSNVGTLELVERDGKAFFRIIAGPMDVCLRGNLDATVVRSPATTIITMTEPISGCPPVRYVIRNDGSGGAKEHLRDGAWVGNRFDHGLTPKK
jgi:hypothetical protein